MSQKDVEPALLRKIVQSHAAGARQVELIGPVVVEAFGLQLSHSQPLEVERQCALLGLINAADLNVVVRDAGSFVSVGIEDRGNFAAEVFRLVEQGGNPEAGNHLVTESFDAVAV